jgi:ureidoacrylate peracid hydrolase
VRYAAELGYDITLVKDAIASYKWDEMRATLEINLPNYATSILSGADTIAALEHTEPEFSWGGVGGDFVRQPEN